MLLAAYLSHQEYRYDTIIPAAFCILWGLVLVLGLLSFRKAFNLRKAPVPSDRTP
jgi:hypothetical protein